tara:strand:+ start:23 stop:412 length:390 start_codon:yes stop_codon:yes gene_type:complete
MGNGLYDKYTKFHFVSGTISYLLLKTQKLSTKKNFLYANTLHLLLELFEHNKTPEGRILETNGNHLSDIIVFLIGWLLGFYINLEHYVPTFITPFLWIFLIYVFLHEILRELYPYNNTIFCKGAFIDSH